MEDNFYSNLPKNLLEKTTKSGDRLIENGIAWGKSYLKKMALFIIHKGGLKKSRVATSNDASPQDLKHKFGAALQGGLIFLCLQIGCKFYR